MDRSRLDPRCPSWDSGALTRATQQLLEQFESLPDEERSERRDRSQRALVMPSARRGEVWLVDLGMAAKVRPALVITVAAEDQDRIQTTIRRICLAGQHHVGPRLTPITRHRGTGQTKKPLCARDSATVPVCRSRSSRRRAIPSNSRRSTARSPPEVLQTHLLGMCAIGCGGSPATSPSPQPSPTPAPSSGSVHSIPQRSSTARCLVHED